VKRRIKLTLLLVILVGLIFGIQYLWRALPILTGYGAKHLCSCVFVSGRQQQDVLENELGSGLFPYARFTVNNADSSATGSIVGIMLQKAVYRKGFGCTLLNGTDEKELRSVNLRPNLVSAIPGDTVLSAITGIPDSATNPIKSDLLQNTVDQAFYEPGEKKLRRIRSLVVLYDGKIVAEKYAPGFDINTPQAGWSMAKSINSALIGILVKQGKLEINAPAPIDAWKNDERHKITLNHLLKASSGLNWEEDYTKPSSATNMLFKEKEMGAFAIKEKVAFPPDSVFYYSSGTANIISYIIRKSLTESEYYNFPYASLFYKIGMYHTLLEPDAGGTFVGSSYCFASARDWAKFGLLYMNDGVWNGERILPEGWVKYTTTPSKAAPQGEYGAQFWLNAGAAGNHANRKYPDVPTDCFWADGFEGQNVWIIPSKKLVVVRLSLEQGNRLDENRFLSELIKALPE
jgi:CubicO group peptidase (beta-lactamase class C family)